MWKGAENDQRGGNEAGGDMRQLVIDSDGPRVENDLHWRGVSWSWLVANALQAGYRIEITRLRYLEPVEGKCAG